MMILTFCYFLLQISSFKRQRLGESKKTGMYKYAIFVSFLLFYAVYIHLLWGKKKIVCSQTKNFFPHINSGYSVCRGKNPSEMEFFRRTKKRKTAFLRLFRSIFLFFADKILRTECWRFCLAGFTGKRKKRRIGGFRLLSSCEKVFRLSFWFFRESRALLICHRGRIERRMDDFRRYGIDVLTDCAGKVRFSFFFAPLGVFCELTIFAYANDGGAVRGNRAAMSPRQGLSLNANGSKGTDRAASQWIAPPQL